MSQHPRPRAVRKPLAVLLGVLLAFGGSVLGTAPAFAVADGGTLQPDVVVSTGEEADPVAGEEAPEPVAPEDDEGEAAAELAPGAAGLQDASAEGEAAEAAPPGEGELSAAETEEPVTLTDVEPELTTAQFVWGVDRNPASYNRPGNHNAAGGVSKLLGTGPYLFAADTAASSWDAGSESGTLAVTGTLSVGYALHIVINLVNPVVEVVDGKGTISAGAQKTVVATFDLDEVTAERAVDGSAVTYRDVPVTAAPGANSLIRYYNARSVFGDRTEHPQLDPITIQLAYDGTPVSTPAPSTAPYLMWFQGAGVIPELDPSVDNQVQAFGAGFQGAGEGEVTVAVIEKGSWVPGGGQAPIVLASAAGVPEYELSEQPNGYYGRLSAALDIPAGSLAGDTEYSLISFRNGTTAYDSLSGSLRTSELVVAPGAPTITVSQVEGLSRDGALITVTGEGFIPDAPATDGTRDPLTGSFGGVYVSFGSFGEGWQPSQGGGSGLRTADRTNTFWLVEADKVDAVGGPSRGAVAIGEDGSFEVTMTVAPDFAETLAGGDRYGVYTYAGGGAVYAPFETETVIAFAPEASAGPTLLVSPDSELDPAVENTVRITGTGFISPESSTEGAYLSIVERGSWAPGAVPTREVALNTVVLKEQISGGAFAIDYVIPAGLLEAGKQYDIATFAAHGASLTDRSLDALAPIELRASGGAVLTVTPSRNLPSTGEVEVTITGSGYEATDAGVYLQLGWLADAWRPSEGALTSARASAYAFVVQAAQDGGPYVRWTVEQDGTASFSLTTTITRDALEAKAFSGARAAVFTIGAHGQASAANERMVALSFASTTVPTPTDPEPGVTPPAASGPQVGSLTWGIKQSFRDYITGFAGGSFTTIGVGISGGLFGFTQTSSSYSADTGRGTISYGGSVRASAHGGQLDYRLSNWRIRFDSAASATILVDFANLGTAGQPSKNGVELARMDLASGSTTVLSTGAIRYVGVPVVAVDAVSIFGNYPAGTAFDSASFTIGASGTATGGTQTAGRTAAVAWTPPATPPAITGLTVFDADTLVEGGEITVEAPGFRPNESEIKVVVYSEPIVLDTNATADAQGIVRWTGTLPAGLSGEHTITLQGSTSVGLPITIAAAETSSPKIGECTVTASQLDWGYKESFRSYISGNANGEWVVADGTEYSTPSFSWSNGEGGYTPEEGVGFVQFAGSIRFTGHSGALDTTVANPAVEFVDADTAYLLLDVRGTTREGTAVDSIAVRFVELDLSSLSVESGELLLEESTATLTPEGAAAFGTYEAGTEFDPVSLRLGLQDDCGTGLAEGPTASVAAVVGDEGGEAPWLVIVLAVLVLLLLAALVAAVLRIRRLSQAA